MPPEFVVIVIIIGVVLGLGIIGMFLFNHFLRGYNEAAGYSDE